ncbi:hypothetical protein BDV12DRAFT_207925 [Aspergillus spectabilis]
MMAFTKSQISPEVREFNCTFCHWEFRLEHLQRHTRRHTKEKPFACSCGTGFSRQSSLYSRPAKRRPSREADEFIQGTTTVQNQAVLSRSRRYLSAERVYSQLDSTPLTGRFTELEQLLSVDHNTPPRDPHHSHQGLQLRHQYPTALPAPQLGTLLVPHFAPQPSTSSSKDTGCFESISGEFTHAPTFKIDECESELVLAMLALGAANKYEFRLAIKLFYSAKAVLMQRQMRERLAMTRLVHSNPERSILATEIFSDRTQFLLCLNESLILRGLLAQTLRLSGLCEPPQPPYLDWETWAQRETERRAKLLAFCILNLQSIAFHLSPIIWSHEFKIQLPCSCSEWTAPDSKTWNLLRQSNPHKQAGFDDALRKVLSAGIDAALHRWTTFWRTTPESNLEPLDPNGPLPFTSNALLSSAYIYNCFNSSDGQSQHPSSWEPTAFATRLRTLPPANRDWDELLAAHHATHILGIVVKLGIEYVKHNQGHVWSIEAALCGLECSVFLNRWLEPESLLVSWIQDIIREARASIQHSSSEVDVDLSSLGVLADQAIEIWSRIMRDNSP